MEVENILNNVKNDITDFIKQNLSGVVIIYGATATGKSKLSILLSDFFPIEIISADSRQIYKYMDIGTDKIPLEYRNKIHHHQIDIVAPDTLYTAGQWQEDVEKIISQIQSKGKIPFIVGGTGLYIDTIYKNFSMPDIEPDFEYRESLHKQEEENPGILYKMLIEIDPEEAMKLHPKSTRHIARALEIFHKTGKTKSESCIAQPVKWPLLMIGLWREKEDTNTRINRRVKEMFELGLVDEVKSLLDKGYDLKYQAMNGIGYKEVVGYLNKEYNYDKMVEILKRNTHHYAKRQRTWFRRYILDEKTKPINNVIYKNYYLS